LISLVEQGWCIPGHSDLRHSLEFRIAFTARRFESCVSCMKRRREKRFCWMLTVFIVPRRVVRAFLPSTKLVLPLRSNFSLQAPCTAKSRTSRTRIRQQSSLASAEYCGEESAETSSPPLFQVHSKFEPTGDQPYAIDQLVRQLKQGQKYNVLKGATGTGKTFVMSHIIARHGKPTLVLVHNKTLAAQLARELRSFFPNHAVELFISAFKSYRPEFYKETTGTYCAKKSTTDADIEALRHLATRSLVTRKDVVVVASVSCIFGLGLPSDYLDACTYLQVGQVLDHDFIEDLERMLYQYVGEDHDKFARGTYQWRETINDSGRKLCTYTFWPPQEGFTMRVELERISAESYKVTAISQGVISGMESVRQAAIFPARHYVVSDDKLQEAIARIDEELKERVKELLSEKKKDNAARLQQRTLNDVMKIREQGYCKGMENYSRHLSGRAAGEPPGTLMDYLGDEWLLIVDESHVADHV
jgi:excinuclease ABC subunit B